MPHFINSIAWQQLRDKADNKNNQIGTIKDHRLPPSVRGRMLKSGT
jgi:hypothetical protein